ncbi:T9SS type A sorting domain-containing protein [Lewinella sp. IMCC34191]|uniref:T9SS type A sorting domain-containing protein n=1 Tax=Lewinella sp. IMCC34191 TaxID=2259172 RepID=UPI000E224A60|nr:T9SS type A sorting domain-containing protein [Lewinella sp. IMCC34191]
MASAALPPVSLVEWTAKPEGSEVDLRWTTNDEAEHDYFVVEHSRDGATFEPLVAIMNPEQSYEGLYRDYHFVHRNPVPGTNYYRLVQYDTDGSVTTFDIQSVHTQLNVTSSVTPNPAHAGQQVGLNGNEEIHEASLYRLDGTLVASYREDQTALSAVTLPANLSTGTYVLRAGQQTHRIFVR